MAVGSFITPLNNDWTRPSDWIDISTAANNEINLLVMDGGIMSFFVNTASGTYSIDWGDGSIVTGRVSGTVYAHQYAVGTGTPCSLGYTTFKIRIYGAASNITRFATSILPAAQYPQFVGLTHQQPLLWTVFGTNGLTAMGSCFGGITNGCRKLQSVTLPPTLTGIVTWTFAFAGCSSLQSIVGLNSPWNAVGATIQSMFLNCISLKTINLPAVLPSSTNFLSDTFNGCTSLRSISFPANWAVVGSSINSMMTNCNQLQSLNIPGTWAANIRDLSGAFGSMVSLQKITLPTTWATGGKTLTNMFGSCFNLTSIDLGTSWGGSTTGATATNLMFQNCTALQSVTVPATYGGNITNLSSMFAGCQNLREINNLEYLGSTGSAANYTTFIGANIFLTGSYTIGGLISKIDWNGSSATAKNAVTGLRFTNPSSTYAGTSPQINISYTNLETGSLVDVFNDLPTLVGKTINITGASGASSLTAGQRAIATGKGWTITG
jgi:hypothetical protein